MYILKKMSKLTQKQKETVEFLKDKKTYDKVHFGVATTVLGKYLKDGMSDDLDSLVDGYKGYMKWKKPDKTEKELEKETLAKFKKDDGKSLLKQLWEEVDDVSNVDDEKEGSSFTKEERLNNMKESEEREKTNGGTLTELNDRLTKISKTKLGEDGKGRAPTSRPKKKDKVVKDTGKNTKKISDFYPTNGKSGGKSKGGGGSYYERFTNQIDKGSKAYLDNKKQVDRVLNKLNKKDLDNGKLFTTIASLEFPEIEILQQVLNFTPLGWSKKDAENLQAIMYGDDVGEDIGIDTIARLLINPDAIGQLITARGKDISKKARDTLSELGRKISGKPAPPSESKSDAIAAANRRIREQEEKKKEKDELDSLLNPDKPGVINWGGATRPVVFDTNLKPKPSSTTADANTYLKKPEQPGYTESSAGEDILGYLKNLLLGRQSVKTKEQQLNALKENNPSEYKRYEQELKQYQYRLKRTQSTSSSPILPGDKAFINQVYKMSNIALSDMSKNKASPDTIKYIFEMRKLLGDITKSPSDYTYAQLDNVTQEVLNNIDYERLEENTYNDVKQQVDSFNNHFDPKFKGDSELADLEFPEFIDEDDEALGDTDGVIVDDGSSDIGDMPELEPRIPEAVDGEPTNPPDGTETERPTKPRDRWKEADDAWKQAKKWEKRYNEISKYFEKKEEKTEVQENVLTDGKARLRPRLAAGNTDAELGKSDATQREADQYLAMLGLDLPDYNNSLYRVNMKQDEFRFKNTIRQGQVDNRRMVPPPSSVMRRYDYQMIPMYAPVFNTSFESMPHDRDKYAQYMEMSNMNTSSQYNTQEMSKPIYNAEGYDAQREKKNPYSEKPPSLEQRLMRRNRW